MGLGVGVETEKFSLGLSVCSELNPRGIICCCSQGIHVLPHRHSLLPRCWNRTTLTFHCSSDSEVLWNLISSGWTTGAASHLGAASQRGGNGTGCERKSLAVLTNNLHLGYRQHPDSEGHVGRTRSRIHVLPPPYMAPCGALTQQTLHGDAGQEPEVKRTHGFLRNSSLLPITYGNKHWVIWF